jgi:hypothetical protein
VEEIAGGAVLRQVHARVLDARLRPAQIAIEGARRRPVPDRQDHRDAIIVEERLHRAAADRLVCVGDQDPVHQRFRSSSSWTARRTWFER